MLLSSLFEPHHSLLASLLGNLIDHAAVQETGDLFGCGWQPWACGPGRTHHRAGPYGQVSCVEHVQASAAAQNASTS